MKLLEKWTFNIHFFFSFFSKIYKKFRIIISRAINYRFSQNFACTLRMREKFKFAACSVKSSLVENEVLFKNLKFGNFFESFCLIEKTNYDWQQNFSKNEKFSKISESFYLRVIMIKQILTIVRIDAQKIILWIRANIILVRIGFLGGWCAAAFDHWNYSINI